MYIYNIVCRSLLCVLLCLFGATLSAQTIIDLDNKGKVRGKTINDYKRESDVARRERNDSIENGRQPRGIPRVAAALRAAGKHSIRPKRGARHG